jgi:hypothetical protein
MASCSYICLATRLPIPPDWSCAMPSDSVSDNRYLGSSCSENRTKLRSSYLSPPKCETKPAAVGLRLLTPLVGQPLSERILARLAQQEAREVDPHLADDYRIAWLCVLHCAEAIPDPWRFAFWRYLGRVPEKLIPLFCVRVQQHVEIAACAGAHPAATESGSRRASALRTRVARSLPFEVAHGGVPTDAVAEKSSPKSFQALRRGATTTTEPAAREAKRNAGPHLLPSPAPPLPQTVPDVARKKPPGKVGALRIGKAGAR